MHEDIVSLRSQVCCPSFPRLGRIVSSPVCGCIRPILARRRHPWFHTLSDFARETPPQIAAPNPRISESRADDGQQRRPQHGMKRVPSVNFADRDGETPISTELKTSLRRSPPEAHGKKSAQQEQAALEPQSPPLSAPRRLRSTMSSSKPASGGTNRK